MHSLDGKRKSRLSLPSNLSLSRCSTSDKTRQSSRESSSISSPPTKPNRLSGRLQRAFRRSPSFDKRHSANRPSSGQLMQTLTGLSATDLNPHITLTHAKRITSFDSADHHSPSLFATRSMTLTSNPTTTSTPHPSRSPSDKSNTSTSNSSYRIPLKIRDYTYAASDPRHQGLGEDGRGTLNIPRENRLHVIFKLLLDDAEYQTWKAAAISADKDMLDSDEADDDGYEEYTDEDDEDDRGWDGQWTVPFEEPDYDDEEEESEDASPLSPGLYRALYPFVPEGSREMPLKEDQVVRVVGQGGGAGWAVVVVDGVDEKGKRRSSSRQLALVPESYLEPIALDEKNS
ncbi:hypothetical protein J3R30DRAFT_3466241 [Lentinula aciculospora]|uniref:SH3 domain-containing protein n=1 Tax=Lentinula aciculospora TaxID=153920 RepID=A0A9W9AG41_9AGAR|nr:hypothetical protein J3R30DRAFT_3466241 [Lentinula aciculospora]